MNKNSLSDLGVLASWRLISILSFALLGCGLPAEKVEGRRVVHEIDAIRDSEGTPAARLDLVTVLESDKVESARAKTARDACAKAYRPLFEATVAMEAVKQAKEDGTVGPEVFGSLRDAEAAIETAKAAMPACEKAHSDLASAVR